MKKRLFILLATVPLLFSCQGDGPAGPSEPEKPATTTLTMVDKDATPQTKALYSNLWTIREKGWIFGHQSDLLYGRKWQYTEGGSDTKEVCGDYPGIYALDIASFLDGRTNTSENPVKLRTVKEAYDRGMVIMACMHLNNPLNGAAYGEKDYNSSNQVAAEILKEGSETNLVFNGWMDKLAQLAKDLKGSDGVQIPIILRPFHEHGHEWSWWGSTCTTQAEYVALWRYLVDGMKERGVHSFIYAISPAINTKATSESEILVRWPGDDYVDFIGIDCYMGINNTVFVNNLKLLKSVSDAKQKPAGVTEIGVKNFQATDYWTTNIAAPMAGRKMSMLVTWSTEYDPMETGRPYYSVYPGHPSEESFRTLYERSDTYFCQDLPDMYTMAANVIVK